MTFDSGIGVVPAVAQVHGLSAFEHRIRASHEAKLESGTSNTGRHSGTNRQIRLLGRPGVVLLQALILAFAVCGCASVATRSTPQHINQAESDIMWLQLDLSRLSPQTSPQESADLARLLVTHARELAAEYRAVSPALLQNVLVNMGWRERGLCYQWADDLEEALRGSPSSGFTVHRCAARVGTYREHNAIVISARDRPFWEGLVIDAWRYSGRLFWGPVRSDRCPWKPACDHPQCLGESPVP
jgi:hypothetical protein